MATQTHAQARGAETRQASFGAEAEVETFGHLLHRGSELLRDRDPGAARERLERALELLPEHATARNLLALALFQLGHFEHAILVYESLYLDFPSSVAAKVNLALVQLKVGRASVARPLLEEAVKAAPEHHRAWGYLGVAFEQLGLIADAERAFLTGHYSSAARGLRERHEALTRPPMSIPDVTPESARGAMRVYRRRTLPPDPWARAATAVPTLGVSSLQKFAVTLRPPDLVRDSMPPELDKNADTQRPPSGEVDSLGNDSGATTIDEVCEIPFDATIAPEAPSSSSLSHAPRKNRPVVPLLDAALSSLLVVPHEASVVVHATGLVLVGMVGGADPDEGGFAARADAVQAFAGALRREPMPVRDALAAQPFRNSTPFMRVAGTGQLILAPPDGSRLLPLDMNADVAFLREDLIVAFDHSLLYDLGRIRCASNQALSLVRFRGDGVIVLKLDHPFLAFDVRGEEAVTLRCDSLIGWIGLLAPEPVLGHANAPAGAELLTFSGEGTVLFRAPRDQ